MLSLTIARTSLGLGALTLEDSTTADYFIEGYTETIGPESYSITFNLSPAHPHLSVFVLDDPERGELDDAAVVLAL